MKLLKPLYILIALALSGAANAQGGSDHIFKVGLEVPEVSCSKAGSITDSEISLAFSKIYSRCNDGEKAQDNIRKFVTEMRGMRIARKYCRDQGFAHFHALHMDSHFIRYVACSDREPIDESGYGVGAEGKDALALKAVKTLVSEGLTARLSRYGSYKFLDNEPAMASSGSLGVTPSASSTANR